MAPAASAAPGRAAGLLADAAVLASALEEGSWALVMAASRRGDRRAHLGIGGPGQAGGAARRGKQVPPRRKARSDGRGLNSIARGLPVRGGVHAGLRVEGSAHPAIVRAGTRVKPRRRRAARRCADGRASWPRRRGTGRGTWPAGVAVNGCAHLHQTNCHSGVPFYARTRFVQIRPLKWGLFSQSAAPTIWQQQ